MPMKPDLGNLYPLLKTQSERAPRSLSYLAQEWPDREAWKARARARMHELLAYTPQGAPLAPEVRDRRRRQGYTQETVSFASAGGVRVNGVFLLPERARTPLPAVVAIHDHGGFYYFGKEKIVENESEPAILTEFKRESYGGRSYASELARRGFAVLVIDGFYFGERRLDPEAMPDQWSETLRQQPPGTDGWIRAFNRFAGERENHVAKTIFTAGCTWPGILFHDDRASVDYLLTRPEVDPDRIGCVGLSIGGFRSAHLCGLDPRIRAAVVVGWMTTYDSLLFDHLRHHTWMIYVPGQLAHLDLPDVASLTAPNPLLVLNCGRDSLFTPAGMKAAEERLQAVYAKMGAGDRFHAGTHDVPHQFNLTMQEEAFAWLERWLKRR
jgi:dienelactone hydrolase